MEKPYVEKFCGKEHLCAGQYTYSTFSKIQIGKDLDLYATSIAFRHCILFKHIRICSRFVSSWHPHVISIA